MNTPLSIGIIGCGKMGSALAAGIQKNLNADLQFVLYDTYREAAEQLAGNLKHAEVVNAEIEVAQKAGTIVLAVKPNLIEEVCRKLNRRLDEEAWVISIAAGVTLAQLEIWLPKVHVVRAMPNTPALVGAGATAYAVGGGVLSEKDKVHLSLIHQLFSSVGIAEQVAERQLNAITGLSGSGPAYIFTVIQALADGAVQMGLSRTTALNFAAQTVFGAAKMVMETGQHPIQLRDDVASPGGTTIAGIAALDQAGLAHALQAAVKAATERANQLSGNQ
jgi:pyrroline-5-carboxylate reductase